jgi:hypothetical protein
MQRQLLSDPYKEFSTNFLQRMRDWGSRVARKRIGVKWSLTSSISYNNIS